MKGFKFSLQAVLTLREEQEQTALQAYAKSLIACDRADSALHTAEEELASGWSSLQRKLKEDTNASELLQLHHYCATLEEQCKRLLELAQLARTKSKESFATFLLARQARSVIERCAEKEKQRYDLRRRKHEQKQLDGMSRRTGGFQPLDDESLLRN